MDRMILPLLGALFLLIMGAGGVWAWDRHPHVGFDYRLPTPLFHPHIRFSLPPSLTEELDATKAAWSAAETRSLACASRLAYQDGRVRLQASLGAAATARSAARIAALESQDRLLESRAARLRAWKPAQGLDSCQAWGSVDSQVVQALGGQR